MLSTHFFGECFHYRARREPLPPRPARERGSLQSRTPFALFDPISVREDLVALTRRLGSRSLDSSLDLIILTQGNTSERLDEHRSW